MFLRLYSKQFKALYMTTNITQQEVLLMSKSSFASRQYCENDNAPGLSNEPQNDKLKEACWNGLVKELMPEIFYTDDKNAKLFLWQVREANHFFALEMSEYPLDVDKYLSIDPYRFMQVKGFN